jgi:hypothetical protein
MVVILKKRAKSFLSRVLFEWRQEDELNNLLMILQLYDFVIISASSISFSTNTKI